MAVICADCSKLELVEYKIDFEIKEPRGNAMSTESGDYNEIIESLLNNTGSELSSLSHVDAPNDSLYMICGVLIAMFLVGVIIILLAVTIRSNSRTDEGQSDIEGKNTEICSNCLTCCPSCISKLRKREEHSNSVHPADVVVQTGGATVVQIPPPALTSPTCPQETITYRGQFLMSQYPPPPPPPYNLYSNDQNMLVQNLRNTERPGLVRGFRKNIGGHWQRLFKRKPEPEVYTIPAELKPQLKQIYVY